jgi:hypothetical protein
VEHYRFYLVEYHLQGDYHKSCSAIALDLQNIRIAASPPTSAFAPSKPTFQCNLISLTFPKILKKNKLHFSPQKNDMLYTELISQLSGVAYISLLQIFAP